jgi:hypothetical protein
MSLDWPRMRDFFAWDGSWRDLYVLGTSVGEWNCLFDALRSCEWRVEFQEAGEKRALPKSATDCFASEERSAMLSILVGGVSMNCHFFTPDEIEFDLDPREVDGQSSLDSLAAFMSFVARATRKTVLLTYENCPECPRCKAEPERGTFDCGA